MDGWGRCKAAPPCWAISRRRPPWPRRTAGFGREKTAGAYARFLDAGPDLVPSGPPPAVGGEGDRAHLAPGQQGGADVPAILTCWRAASRWARRCPHGCWLAWRTGSCSACRQMRELEGTEGGGLCKQLSPLQAAHARRDGGAVSQRRMRYSDTDINGHVNNTRYADFVCDALRAGGPGPAAAFCRHLQIGYTGRVPARGCADSGGRENRGAALCEGCRRGGQISL